MNFNQAFKIVSTWIDVYTDGIAEVSEVIDKPYGWIFFYQYKGFDPNDISTYMGGNAPIIFDRIDGEIRVTGTDQPLEFYLKKYEDTLPETRLLMSPEVSNFIRKFNSIE